MAGGTVAVTDSGEGGVPCLGSGHRPGHRVTAAFHRSGTVTWPAGRYGPGGS